MTYISKETKVNNKFPSMTAQNTPEQNNRFWSVWWPCLFLCLWALGIRLVAMGKVFPAQGDASHFIQYGKEYATRGLEGISGVWAIMPQFLTSWSVDMGWMPQYVLQATTVCFGVLLVAGVYALALELLRNRKVAFVAGLLVATNPVLVSSATSGLSETPHMALGMWALALAFAGARKRQCRLFAAAAAVASLEMYYRPHDTFLYLAGALPFLLWRLRGAGWRKPMAMLGAGFCVGGLCLVPFFVITTVTSTWSAARSKMYNIAYAEDGYGAANIYAANTLDGANTPVGRRLQELEEKGAFPYLWAHKAEIVRRYPGNVAKGIRSLNEHLFVGKFRLGLFWFLLAMFLSAMATRKEMSLYAACGAGVFIGSFSLGFINPRWMMQCMPFCVIVFASGFAWIVQRISAQWIRRAVWGCLMLAGIMNGQWAVARLDDEWKQRNVFPVCDRLHQWMSEDERLMCFHPELPALFYQTNTLCWDNIPYGSAEEVFALAEAHGVDCFVLDDSVFTHFPVHEIEREPELLPVPWKEIDRMEFEHQTRFALERNVWRIYRRDDD